MEAFSTSTDYLYLLKPKMSIISLISVSIDIMFVTKIPFLATTLRGLHSRTV